MKLKRSLQVALLGAVLITRALAQTEADIASLLPKAQRGNAIAQYNLGLAYMNGKGVAADPIEAYVWLSLAHESGFHGKALGVVAGGLDPADFETARKRLAERRAALNLKPATAAPAKPEPAEAESNIPVVRTDAAKPAAATVSPAAPPSEQNSNLIQELASAVADKQQLSNELSKSWAEAEELKKQLTETQATADFLTAETSKLHGERDTLTAKLKTLTSENSALHTERDNARALGVQAESQKASFEASLKEVQASAATDKKWLSDELTKSFQEVTALKTQLAAAAKIASAAPAYPDLSDKVKELEASLAATSTKAAAAQQEATRLADDRIEREKQLITLQQQAADSATARAALQQDVQNLRKAAAIPVAPAYPDLREQVASLKSEANQAQQQIAALTQAKETAEKSLARIAAAPAYPDLSGKVKELEANVSAISAKANAAEQRAAESAATHATLQQEVQRLRTAAATPAAPAYPDLREQVASLESQVVSLKSDATRANNQIATLNLAKIAAEKSLAQIPAAPAYPDLSGKVKDLEASLASLSTKATAAQQEATRLADDRIEREKQLISLQQQSAELAAARESLQQENQNLRKAAATPAAPAYPDVRGQVASLESQIATLKSESGQASQKIAALTQARDAAEKSLAQIPAAPAYPDLSSKVRELEASVAALSAKATAAQQEATRLADDRIEREKQLIALQQQSAELATARDALQQEVQNLRKAAATPAAPTYPDLRERVASLEAQVVALKTEANDSHQQIATLNHAKVAAEKSLAQIPAAPAYPDLSGKVKELEASLSVLSAKATAAQQEATRLADDRIEREKQLIALQQQSAELGTARDNLQQEVQNLRKAAATPAAVAYPDLSVKVRELESSLAVQTEAAEKSRAALQALQASSAQPATAAPAYPDLSDKVKELEASLAARSADAGAASKSTEELRQAKADAEQKLAAAEQSRSELSQQFEEFKRSALANQRENLNRQSRIQMLESEKAALRQQSNADQTRLAELSSQLAASRRKSEEVYPTAPAYPDQRARVEQLEAELTKTNEQANGMIAVLNRSQQDAKASAEQIEQLRTTIHDLENKAAAVAPAYPDLREQVSNLEIQLDAARALPKNAVSPTEFNNIKQELADTKVKLATTLKGYALIEKERDTLANRPAAPVAPDQSARVRELEAQLAAKPTATPAAPDYPDLREKVATLEAAASAAKSAPPAYPDLREQVSNLEIQLDAARALPKNGVSPTEFNNLKQELADTKEKLATTLRGYSLLEKERDELAAKPGGTGNGQTDVARLTEAYNALQRTNAQNERDLVLLRAQLQQIPGATTSLAQQNTPPRIVPVPVVPRIVPTSATPSTPVIAAGPAPAPVRRTHVVVAGDTLVKISQHYYGNASNWQPIYDANRELLGPKGTLKVGTELRIP